MLWVNGSVTTVKQWTKTLFSLVINAPIAPFIAGQYTKLAVEIAGKKMPRAYSFVNAPQDNNLEFYLVHVPNGKLSPHLHRLTPGDEILIYKQATGFFTLHKIPPCRYLWMLATGTAIGPYLSILQANEGLAAFEQIILVHAVRYQCDLSYLSLMQQLKKAYGEKLQIQTIVSREKSATSLYGRIPERIMDGSLERAVGCMITPADSHIMLCGNPAMLRDTQHVLQHQRQLEKNLINKPGHITSEQYW